MTTKYCKDCKFLKNELWCHSPRNGIDIVDGLASVRLARINRYGNSIIDVDRCDVDGKFFEEKELTIKKPFWKFW